MTNTHQVGSAVRATVNGAWYADLIGTVVRHRMGDDITVVRFESAYSAADVPLPTSLVVSV